MKLKEHIPVFAQ